MMRHKLNKYNDLDARLEPRLDRLLDSEVLRDERICASPFQLQADLRLAVVEPIDFGCDWRALCARGARRVLLGARSVLPVEIHTPPTDALPLTVDV